MEKSCKKVCITGGAGYIGSWLVKKLLEKGYTVHATLRNLNDNIKVGLLKSFPYADQRLVLFEADIYKPDQFQPAIEGCAYVLHVATPMQHTDNDTYKNTTEAAVEGVKRIVESCIRSGTVKRLVYTASVVAASAIKDDKTGYKEFVDETCWTSLDHNSTYINDFRKAYAESKTIAEREVLSYAGKLEVVTLACGLVGGETLLPSTPISVSLCISPLTRFEYGIHGLKHLEYLLGKIPVVHIDDVCEAHIFSIENPSISGRYLCAGSFLSYASLAHFFEENYPGEYHLKQEYMDVPKTDVKWGSTKLIDIGFRYTCDIKDILEESVKCARRIGEIL